MSERVDGSAFLDLDNLSRHVAEGNIARKIGPHGLVLYNYTQKAQWSQAWDAETMACRGLILDRVGRVQSRPFGKFFNLTEHANPALPPLPAEPFDVFEKVDGSLVVASTLDNGETLLTTRGSFESKQAHAAGLIWECESCGLVIPEGETWCFEFVAPWNRIVVDYGSEQRLVLLARLDNATGRDLPLPEWPGQVARTFDGLADFDAITERMAAMGPDEEGYVLRFASGMRAKAKGAEYVRLHKLLTGVSARTIWECLASGSGLDDILERVPDEFFEWVSRTAAGLRAQYEAVQVAAEQRHAEVVGLPSRKHQALAILDFEHKAAVFSMLDGKPYADGIWRHIKPEADRPFTLDETA